MTSLGQIAVLAVFAVSLLFSNVVSAANLVSNKSSSVLLKEDDVRKAVSELLAEKVAGRGWETRITQIAVPSNIKLPPGQPDIEITPPPRWDGWGNTSMSVMVRINGKLERNFSIRVSIDARADMLVAKRQLTSGTIISAADVAVEKHDIAAVNGRYVASIENALRRRLRGTVRQGFPLKSDQLEKVPVIKSGQMVTILAESQSLKITVTGRARGAGSEGDLIMVQPTGSMQEIPAKIVDSSTVLIGF